MTTKVSGSESIPQTTQGKIEKAMALKVEGNAFFKEDKYTKAKQRYATALAYTRGLPGREGNGGDNQMAQFAESSISGKEGKMEPAQNQEVDELDAILKTNIAACFLKLNKPADALQYAREAIIHNPRYWKASLRAAEAMESTKNYDGALKQLDLLSSNPTVASNAGAIRTMRSIREKVTIGMKTETNRQKKAFGDIFQRMNKESGDDGVSKLPVAEAVAAPTAEVNRTSTMQRADDESYSLKDS